MPTAPISSCEVRIVPGQPLPAPQDAAAIPAFGLVRTHQNDFFSMMGMTGLSYGGSTPDVINISFQTPEFATLADNVLRDSVNGVRLVMRADAVNRSPAAQHSAPFASSKPAARSDWWSFWPTNLVRSVAAMPGVTGWRWLGDRTAIVQTATPEDRRRLWNIVERRPAEAVEIMWSGECHGPGCDPADRPPSQVAVQHVQ